MPLRSLLVLALVVVTVVTGVACDSAAPALPVAGPNALEIVVQTTPPGASVSVDGVPAGVGPATVKLNPGPHRLRATMNGYTAAPEQKIQVGQTEPREHMLYLVASH